MCWNSHSDYNGVSFSDEAAGWSPDPGMRVSQSVVSPEQVQAAQAAGNGEAAGRLRNEQLFQQWRYQIHTQATPPPPPAATGTFGLQIAPAQASIMQLRTGRS